MIIIEWNKLDINLHNSGSLFIFKKNNQKFIWILCVTVIIRNTWHSWLAFIWAWIIYEITILGTVSKIPLILNVIVFTKLNLQLLFSSTVLCSQIRETLSLTFHNLDCKLFQTKDFSLKNLLLFGKESFKCNLEYGNS